jgi:chromosome segregation ATPase
VRNQCQQLIDKQRAEFESILRQRKQEFERALAELSASLQQVSQAKLALEGEFSSLQTSASRKEVQLTEHVRRLEQQVTQLHSEIRVYS